MIPPAARIYQHGTDLLLAGPRLTVLLPASCGEHVGRLWDLVDSFADMDDLLEWLIDQGFRSFPSLLAVDHQADHGPRLLLRGPAAVTIARADGSSEAYSGAEWRTWLDVAVPDAVQLWTGDSPTVAAGFPLRHGVVHAAGFAFAPDDTGTAPVPNGRAAAVISAPPPPAEPPVAASLRAAGSGPHPHQPPAPAEPLPTDEPATAPEPEPEPTPAPEPGSPAPVSAPESTDGFPDATVDPAEALELAPVPELDDEPDPTDPRDVAAAAVVIDSSDLPGLDLDGAAQYEQVWGATRKSTVEHAAVRLDDPLAEDDPGQAGAPSTAGPAVEGDHDGRTITTEHLAKLRGQARVSAAPDPVEGDSPRLRAAVCGQGHPNPPNQEACRVCGAALDDAPLRTIDRPVLGVLAFVGGPRAPLAGTIIIGRSPRMPSAMRSDIPTLLAVDSPEGGVSRSHLEVCVEGWSASVVDLGSTNGTEVTLPGEQPRRLRRGEPCLITPGTVVTLGDEVSATYEAAP